MDIKLEENIREKIKNIEWESNFWNRPQNLARVRMLHCECVNDEKTTIGTYGIATCIGLAISATDSKGVIHRIVMHHSYTGEARFEGRIEDYLKSLGPIENLKAMICSMKSFEDFEHIDEREQEILKDINDIFAFYKEMHKDFNVPFYRSWYVKIFPNGEFEYASPEMVKVYKKMEKEQYDIYDHSDNDNFAR